MSTTRKQQLGELKGRAISDRFWKSTFIINGFDDCIILLSRNDDTAATCLTPLAEEVAVEKALFDFTFSIEMCLKQDKQATWDRAFTPTTKEFVFVGSEGKVNLIAGREAKLQSLDGRIVWEFSLSFYPAR